ncbi:hypothetical protein [Virgibacillus salexigens]|uniref:hypothetical protein n=1 Tax=Virgibacillus salexigens TaxID=61016 RepID=UPI00190D461D|nr:hypothetical protein [Virgibacillus salexigens]
MMIVRIKTLADTKTQEKVRERIKQQIEEGLIVHDDTIEITFADVCSNCGSDECQEITLRDDIGNVHEHVFECEKCGKQRSLLE